MMAARKDGRWGNTQENAHAMEALVNYYRKYEPTVPNFRGVASLGTRELVREDFRGRSADAATTNVPMPQVVAAGRGRTEVPLTFRREGTGTLFYSTRLRYAVDTLYQDGLDQDSTSSGVTNHTPRTAAIRRRRATPRATSCASR
jgi:hypothetical protein